MGLERTFAFCERVVRSSCMVQSNKKKNVYVNGNREKPGYEERDRERKKRPPRNVNRTLPSSDTGLLQSSERTESVHVYGIFDNSLRSCKDRNLFPRELPSWDLPGVHY